MITPDKLKESKEDIAFLERKAYKLLSDISRASSWYPECHNDHTKRVCSHCMGCWDVQCNRQHCDRVGRCLCEGTSCQCLGR